MEKGRPMKQFLFFLIITVPLAVFARIYLTNDNPDQLVSISSVGNVSFGSAGTNNPICQPVGILEPVTSLPGHYTEVGNSFELSVPQAETGQTPGYAQTAKVYSTESTSRYFINCDSDHILKVSDVINGNISNVTNGDCQQEGLPSLGANTDPCATSTSNLIPAS
jgi:hypothetical protein